MSRSGRAALFIAAIAANGACEASEQTGLEPVPVDVTTLTPGGGGSPPTPPPDAGPRIRTVAVRNPLGGSPGNLLVDGDFEFSISRGWGQFAWVSWSSSGDQALKAETGGLCRTGLRCLVLDPHVALWGQGAAADGVPMVASVWVKVPAESPCSAVTPMAANCNGYAVGGIPPVSETPAEDGWCAYRVQLDQSSEAVCMYVESTMWTGQQALIDSARIEPATGTVPRSAPRPRAVSDAARQRVRTLAEWVRKRRRFGTR
jgi:hypothetical protein